MAQVRTWAAFDVHLGGVVAATLERESGDLRVQRLPGRSEDVAAFAAVLPGPVRATHEAGPSGFVLARELAAIGVECVVCAPGLIPRGPSDRVKTDRRDAERLVRLLAAGELHPVAVPTVAEEALRDLVRAREDLRGDLMRARHRLAKLLLRHEVRFDGPQANWTQTHLGWPAGVTPAEPASQRAFEDYRGEVLALMIRREQLEAEIAGRAAGTPAGSWSRPPGTTAGHSGRGQPRALPARRRAARAGALLKGAAAAASRLDPDGAALQRRTIIAVAAGRELAGFCWALATTD